MNYDVFSMINEQLESDIDALVNKYGIEYAQRMKSILNTKIETKKMELEIQKKQLEKLNKRSYDDEWQQIFNNSMKR